LHIFDANQFSVPGDHGGRPAQIGRPPVVFEKCSPSVADAALWAPDGSLGSTVAVAVTIFATEALRFSAMARVGLFLGGYSLPQ
jgi:hypothetical protein